MKPLLYSKHILGGWSMGDTEKNVTESLPQGVYNLVENKLYNIRQKMTKISKGGLDKASWTLRRRGDGGFCDGRGVL